MTATDMTAFYAFSLPRNGQFSPRSGAISFRITHLKPGETGKNPPEKIQKKSSGDSAPKLQISVPCRGRTCPDCFKGSKRHAT